MQQLTMHPHLLPRFRMRGPFPPRTLDAMWRDAQTR